MPKYGDDQCVQCGGIRVAKSTLCAGCIVRQGYEDEKRRLEMESVIEALKANVTEKELMLNMLLNHGFMQNRLINRLHRKISALMNDVHGPEGKDG